MTGFDVAIVGAGAAGIAAARTLQAAGRRVILLESRARAGGRACTSTTLGIPVDLGAAWLHFADENAWTGLANEGGFTVLHDKPSWGASASVGAHAPTAAECAQTGESHQRYDAAVTAAAQAGRDLPVADVVPRDAYRPRFDAVMTWAVGRESREVSTLDVDRYADSDENWAVHEGMGAVVAAVARPLPIQFESRVDAIDWAGSTIRIDGTMGRIEAAAVIVTVPTALLAKGSIRFHPALPQEHQQAIAALPLGVCNKVFFTLREGMARELPRHFIGSAGTSRTCAWQTRPARQPVLMAYFGGDLSWDLEQRGELEAFAREELRSAFGTDLFHDLGATLTTAWGGDPHSLGSYSAALPGHAFAREQLAVPVSPRLHLAGEACDVSHFGTLHGAWRSGVAAANRLL